MYRLRASNISNINTDENKNNTLDIKENIDGIETVGKTIDSGIALAVLQMELASAIGTGLSAGVKISAGQPLLARVITTTATVALAGGVGIVGAGKQVGATALNNALNQLLSNLTEETIENLPSPSLVH